MMKMKALFFALLVGISSAALANNEPAMKVVPLPGSETFKVIYKGTTPGRIKLNILDASGRTLHTRILHDADGFIVPLNFSGLSSGKYTIEVLDRAGRHVEDVVFKPLADLKTIHVSKLVDEEGKFLFVVANAQNEPVFVRIYDEYRRLIHEDSKVLSGDFAQVYRLDTPAKGYAFEVSDAAGNRKWFNF